VILRPLSNFSGNGVLRGTITALDDLGDPLGWEAYGNWSDRNFVERSARQLAAATGIDQDRARMLLTSAIKQARKLAGTSGTEDDTVATYHELPVIVTSNRYLRDLAQESWQLLAVANEVSPDFFQFGSALCDLVTGSDGVRARILTITSLRNRLDRLADFVRFDKAGDEYPSRPPKDLLEDMLAQANPTVPHLQGVVRGPVCRPDGSIAATEGYDPATGLYLALGDLQVPPVADAPSENDMARAKRLLLEELLGDFPFATAADQAHALSEIITPVVRSLITGPTPLHVNEAPSPGSGKDLLADCASLIATGGLPAAMTEGRDDDEWRKRITAKLITAPTMVLIDNVKRRLDSGALSAALERPLWEDRHLGLSRMVTVPIRCIWVCTANNPSLSDEIARRTARVRIDTQTETPWERSGFRHPDLRAWVRDHRGELLWAVLTLVRHWAACGRPRGDQSIGSYESWSDVVGGILKAAGIEGFLGNRLEVYQQSQSDSGAFNMMVELWWEHYRDQRVDVGRLFALAKDHRLLTELRAGRTDQGARVVLGRMLADRRDRIIGGYRIRQLGVGHGGGMTYQMEELYETDLGSGKSSPLSPSSPDGHAQDGEDGEDGDNISDLESANDDDLTELCERCQSPLPTLEVYRYSPSGALCFQCDEESDDDK
jgi:putative DNA primase/helicase